MTKKVATKETTEFELLDHQDEFIFSDARYPCLDGGYGNGKSTAWMIRIGLHCQNNPGTKTGVFREELSDLKKSTKQEFEDLFGAYGNYHENNNVFTFDNGSTVLFHQLTDMNKLRNHNFSACVIEQAEESSEEAFFTLVGRLRRTDTDNSEIGIADRWLSVVSNPEGHDWIWKLWIKGDIPEPDQKAKDELDEMGIDPPSADDYHYICAESFDNKENLSDDYLKELTQMPEHMRKKYVYASRDVLEGAIYTMLEQNLQLIPGFEIPKDWPKWTTLDWGGTNPTANLWITMDYQNRIYVYREHYKAHGDDGKDWIVSEHVDEIEGHEEDRNDRWCPYIENIRFRMIDPACTAKNIQVSNQSSGKVKTSIVEEFEKYGMPMTSWRRANSTKEKHSQINRVSELFAKSDDFEHPKTEESPAPQLYIFERCKNTWEEHRQYEWKEQNSNKIGKQNKPEEPKKYKDHTCDALRGFCAEKMAVEKQERDVAKPGTFDYAKKYELPNKNKSSGKFNFNL